MGALRPKSASRIVGEREASRLPTRTLPNTRGHTPARLRPSEVNRSSLPGRNLRASTPLRTNGSTRSASIGNSTSTSMPASSTAGAAARRTVAANIVSGAAASGIPKPRTSDAGKQMRDSSIGSGVERRRSRTTINAGKLVASSSSSGLGNCSNASSSPRSSTPSDLGDKPKESKTAARSSKGESDARSKKTSEVAQIQVPVGVEEDFEPYTWLSDAGIAFASSCLTVTGSSLHNRPCKFSKNVLFMDPAMVFWLVMQDDPEHLAQAKVELKLPSIDLMLCPINDAHTAGCADAGCHWSLLVCWGERPASMRGSKAGAKPYAGPFSSFIYYDSLGGLFAEKGFAQSQEFGARLCGQPVEVEVGSCARQTNFYDCGIYVVLFMEIIAASFLEMQRQHSTVTGTAITPAVWEKRLMALTPEEVDHCRAYYHQLAIDKAGQKPRADNVTS